MSYLLRVTGTNSHLHVHVVFDGVATVYKESQQLERIKDNFAVYEIATRSFIKGEGRKRFDLVHLFGEDAMLEATRERNTKVPRFKLMLHTAPCGGDISMHGDASAIAYGI